MQHMESVQIVKEQLKLKNKEIRNYEREKAELVEKLNNIMQANQQKINEFKVVIAQKDEEIKTTKDELWAVKTAKHTILGQNKEEKPEEGKDDKTPANALEEIERLRAKDKEQKTIIETRRQELITQKADLEKLNREKLILLKELKRMRDSSEESAKQTGVIESLKDQIKQLSGRASGSGGASANMEQLIKEKDDMIASYEKMLYGSSAPGQEGMLPAEIIVELKEELENLEEERKSMIMELEQVKELNAELEMKMSFGGEKGAKGAEGGGFKMSETSTVEAAEFHMGLEKFLISYADLITLLLVMFIFLYSISKIDDTKLAEAFGKSPTELSIVMRLTPAEMRMLERVKELVKDNVDPESLVRSDIRTILIRLPTSELFAPGSANFIEDADKIILNAIKDEMQEGVKQVMVDGHTDNVPMKSDIFPSNWELSSARASRVARFIMEGMRFPPDRIVVAGYGEYRPLQTNDSDEHRAMNRRVEIKILKDKEVVKEKSSEGADTKTKGTETQTNKAAPGGQPKQPAAK